MNTKCELKYCQDIIDSLIFSNIQSDEENPYHLYINFSVYRITFEGNEKSSLKDACKYFKQQIALITKDWKY